MNITTIPNDGTWRFVHDGTKVILKPTNIGQTQTTKTVFTASTKEACDAEIERLGLVGR